MLVFLHSPHLVNITFLLLDSQLAASEESSCFLQDKTASGEIRKDIFFFYFFFSSNT